MVSVLSDICFKGMSIWAMSIIDCRSCRSYEEAWKEVGEVSEATELLAERD